MTKPNSTCWHCFRTLMRRGTAGERPLGEPFFFRLVEDRDGRVHRVHHQCVEEVTKEGHAKLVRPVAEQQ